MSAELPTGGVRVNYIPKDGGNRLSGTFVFGFGNGAMQSDNFSDELKAAGLGTPNALKRSYDYNPGIGGPILRDRLWFHVAYKKQLSESYPAGIFTNLNANDPNSWTYAPDRSSRPFNAVDGSDLHVRLTWQALPKLKIGFSDQESGLRVLGRHQRVDLARGRAAPQEPQAAELDGRLDRPVDQ